MKKKLLYIIIPFLAFSGIALASTWSMVDNSINGLVKNDGLGNFGAVVSGTDVKTINGNSILGSGNLTIVGGSASTTLLSDSNTFSGINSFTNALSNWSGLWQNLNPGTMFYNYFHATTTDALTEGSTNKYDKTVALSNGTGISTSGTYPNFTITNTAPDQTVTLNNGTNISVTGSYPTFTINSTVGGGASTTLLSDSNTWTGLTNNFSNLCILGDCKTAWPAGGSGGGTGWASTTDITSIKFTGSGTVNIGTSTDSLNPTQPGKLTIDCGSTLENCTDSIGNINDFLEHNITNLSKGNGAQSGYSATADTGSLTTGFMWMGINNSQFWNPTSLNVGGPLDTSLLSESNDFYIGQGIAGKKTHFLNGGVSTSTNEVMTFSGNNVGVGTSSPYSKLTVWGNGFTSATQNFELVNSASTTLAKMLDDGTFYLSGNLEMATTTSYSKFTIWDTGSIYATSTGLMNVLNNASTSLFAITEGSTTISNTLDVANGYFGAQSFPNDSGVVSWIDMPSSTTTASVEDSYSATINNNQVLKIFGLTTSSAGVMSNLAVQIGATTTRPYAKLSVVSDGAGTGQTFELVNTSSTTLLKVLDNGTITFNSLVYPSCTGFTTSAAGVVACTASDGRMKENINPLGDELSKLMQLNPVSYQFKKGSRNDDGGIQHYGLIAQDVQKIFPSVVRTGAPTDLTPGGTLQLDYNDLLGITIKAVQQIQKERIAPLQRSANDNWQWIAIALLFIWNLSLTFKKK